MLGKGLIVVQLLCCPYIPVSIGLSTWLVDTCMRSISPLRSHCCAVAVLPLHTR
jgi:hypothetical protein